MPKKVNKKIDSIDFEKSLDELTKIIEKMEEGNLSLEASLESFEKGVALIRQCQNALSNAQQKVEILLEQQNEETLKAYQPENE